MKLYLTCLILLAAMVALCILGITFLSQIVEQTCDAIETADRLYRSGDLPGAEAMVARAEALWKRQETPLDAILSHEDLDTVMTDFATLRAYALCGDPDDYYGLTAAFLARMEHIRDSEQPTLKNIF